VSARWFITRIPRPSASTRLFCFPHAGASAAAYHRWADALPESIELHAAELPGRASRLTDRAISEFEPLIDAILPDLLQRADRRFAFFGHSMGALIAFELARRLQREGHATPATVFVSGQNAPHLPAGERMSEWPDPQLAAEIARLNGTADGVLQNKAFQSHFLSVIRADLRLVEGYAYRPDPLLRCALVVFAGTDDPHVSEEGADSWQQHTSAAAIVRKRAGGHFVWWNDDASITGEIARFLERSEEER